MKYGELKGRRLDYWVEHVRRGAPASEERIPRYHRGAELDGLVLRLVDIPSWAAAGADLRRSSDFTKLVQIEGGIGLTGRLRAYLSQNGFDEDRDVMNFGDGHPLSFEGGRRPKRFDEPRPYRNFAAVVRSLESRRPGLRCPECKHTDVNCEALAFSEDRIVSMHCKACGHEDHAGRNGTDLERIVARWHEGAEPSPQ